MIRIFIAVVLLVGLLVPATAGRRGDDRGWHRGHWDRHQHREHRREQPSGGIDFGAIIGGVISAFGDRPSPDAIAYCMQKYRSYNPETGIYYGYDGQPRRCP